jgi:uncharacterized membrane protein YoaK (UPF0700 family)
MQERTHHPSGPLGLAIALAAAAGFVDAHIYVNVTPVFVANMSGNLIHMGISLGNGEWNRAVATVLALAAFTTGVIVATVHHDRQVRRGREVHPAFLVAVEAALLAALTIWLIASPVSFAARPRAADYPVLVVAALAMGIQAGALRRVGEIAVATTYGTGAMVRIGEKLVLAARRADRSSVHRRRVAIAVLVLVLVSYVCGAIIATLAGSSPWLLALPTAVLVACAVAGRLGHLTESAMEPDLSP